MQVIPPAVERLISELGKLPGVGPRTAERLAFYILKSDRSLALGLASATSDLHSLVRNCQNCFNFAESDLCGICSSPTRTSTTIAVVEEPFDVVAIEKTGLYQGLYHVLGGTLSPIDGIGPSQLQIASLLDRVRDSSIEEVILATNPSLEGESTAMYIRTQLEPAGAKVTRLARGLPVGGDLEYADQITLGRALQGRQAF
jgi:recombination protein RecR